MCPALGALGLAAGMAASALNVNSLGIMNKSAFCFLFGATAPDVPASLSASLVLLFFFFSWGSNQFHTKPGPSSTASAARTSLVGRPVLPVPDRSTYCQLLSGGLYSPTSPKVSECQSKSEPDTHSA